jgi:hypothetical protein
MRIVSAMCQQVLVNSPLSNLLHPDTQSRDEANGFQFLQPSLSELNHRQQFVTLLADSYFYTNKAETTLRS